jgi:hypothetical protein
LRGALTADHSGCGNLTYWRPVAVPPL